MNLTNTYSAGSGQPRNGAVPYCPGGQRDRYCVGDSVCHFKAEQGCQVCQCEEMLEDERLRDPLRPDISG
jgi:hypothetical protein